MKINKPSSKKNEATSLKLLSIIMICLLKVGKKRINLIIRSNRNVLNTLIPLDEFDELIELFE
jgi:hypothetical protein